MTFEQLVAYASGELEAAEADRVEAYLAVLPDEAREVARLRDVLETLRTVETEPPPAEAVRRALAAFSQRAAARGAWTRHLGRIVAQLVFDSRSRVALAGYRGSAAAYHMGFDCPAARIDVQIAPAPDAAPDRWRLRGQVTMHEQATLGTVSLVPEGTDDVTAWSMPDRFGRFRLESAPGVYDLLIGLDQGARGLVVPELEVGAA